MTIYTDLKAVQKDIAADIANGLDYSAALEIMMEQTILACIEVCEKQREPHNVNFSTNQKYADALRQTMGV